MKLKARVLQSNRYGYNILTWQIFEVKKDIRFANAIGTIEFQEYNGNYTDPTYNINTSRLQFIEEMYKIAKFIKNISDYKTTSDEIKSRLNFEEIILYKDEFQSLKDYGKKAYHTIDIKTNEVYGLIVAKDDKEASKLSKNSKYGNLDYKYLYTLDFNS
jgi:hypothetical protein